MKKVLGKKIILIVALVCVLTFAMMLSACDLLFPARLMGIEATYSGGDVVVGDDLDVSKVTVSAHYSNRNSKEVTGWKLSDLDTSTAGKKTVTVTYTEQNVTATDTFDVTVVPVALESLSATYSGGSVFVGGTLDQTAIVVTASYNGKSVADKTVTDYTLSGFDSATTGVKTVTVSYTEDDVTATATFTVEVVQPKLKSISAIYTGTDVAIGESLDRSKITVTATYEDDTTKTVTRWTCSFDSSSAGSKTATVSYTDNGVTATATFTVNVYASALDHIKAEYVGGDIYVGNRIDRTKLTVTAYLENGSTEIVTNYTLSPTRFDTAGDQQPVTVSYTVGTVTKTTTFTVNVKSLVLESLTVEYKGGSITIGAQPKKSDFVVTAHYNSGKTVTVTDFEVEFDSSEAGEKPCKILYGGQSATVNITVVEANPGEARELDYDQEQIANENFSIHFLELGNGSNGDAIYIKAGDNDILIDAGSQRNSAKTIGDYIDRYCTDGTLEFVIATHGDADHIYGFAGASSAKGIFERYVCETIIDFPRTTKTTAIYKEYVKLRDAEVAAGAKHYTALDCVKAQNGAQRVWQLTDDVTMTVLYQEYYEKTTSNENDGSVCLLFTQGEYNYYLLGDLEEAGEKSLVANNPDLPQATLYKGGHHGSKTSANTVLMSKIQPKYVCICCVAGSIEYTQNKENTFPTQAFINRVAPYTDRVYATDMATVQLGSDGKYEDVSNGPLNGTIVFACTNAQLTMYFSNNNTKLKDTEWFASNRTMPEAWKS